MHVVPELWDCLGSSLLEFSGLRNQELEVKISWDQLGPTLLTYLLTLH